MKRSTLVGVAGAVVLFAGGWWTAEVGLDRTTVLIVAAGSILLLLAVMERGMGG